MSDEREGDELVENLKKLAEKKESEPPPELTRDVVINLAGMTPLQYAQQLTREAKKYRTPLRLLEKAVEEVRVEQATESLLMPHWQVTPLEEEVDIAALLADLEARILYHVAMPKHLAFVCALWIAQTWVHEHATYSPILFVTSPERDSGKSTLMNVIKFMVRRELSTVSITAAALYRSIEKWNPTFVIDEADKAFIKNFELEQVVNSGWTRGSGIIRCHPDTHEPVLFPTFCPKAIASKGKQAPDTILSRAIFITLKRRTRAETIAHFAHVDDAGFQRLRGQLARWAADNGQALGGRVPEPPDGFINRIASNWQLMLAIADSAGMGKRAREAARLIAGITDLTSEGVTLLEDIKAHFARSTLDYVGSKALIADLIADTERPWAEWSHGRPISEKGVAQLLHGFGIKPGMVGPENRRLRGYKKEWFEEAWERYLGTEKESESIPKEAPQTYSRTAPCNHSTFDDFSPVQPKSAVQEENAEKSNGNNALYGCTGNGASRGSERSFSPVPDDGLDLPASCRRCAHCGKNGTLPPSEIALPDRTVWLHRECEAAWMEENNGT
jgi:putative DNA primase/helicase